MFPVCISHTSIRLQAVRRRGRSYTISSSYCPIPVASHCRSLLTNMELMINEWWGMVWQMIKRPVGSPTFSDATSTCPNGQAVSPTESLTASPQHWLQWPKASSGTDAWAWNHWGSFKSLGLTLEHLIMMIIIKNISNFTKRGPNKQASIISPQILFLALLI